MNKKFIVIASSVVVVLLAVGAYLLFEHANPWLENKIATQINSLKKGPVDIKYSDLDVNILSGHATIKEVNYTSHNNASEYKITFDKLKITGLGVASYIFNKEIKFDKIILDNPAIEFISITDAAKDSTEQSSQPEEINFPDILIKSFETNEGTFKVSHRKDSVTNPLISGNFIMKVKDLSADSTVENSYKYFNLNDLDFSLSKINVNLPDSLYKLDVKNVKLNLKRGSLDIDTVKFASKYKKFQLAQVVNHEIDWADVVIPAIKISGINVTRIIEQGVYLIDCISIENTQALIFRDKRLKFPQSPDTKLLHQVMEDLDIKLAIDTIKIKNADVEYQEFVKQAVGPGRVSFNNLYASMYNLTNIDSISAKTKDIAYVDAQSNLMGKSLLKASFTFPLKSNGMPYTASGSLKDMELDEFNPMLQEVAFVKIDKGHLIDLSFEFNYNLISSDGSMKFIYEGLKINTLDKESNKSEGLGEEIKSFIANTFVVKTNNLADNSFRVGDISFDRDPKKSVFNYWWKSLLTGFRSSTGIKAPKERIDMN